MGLCPAISSDCGPGQLSRYSDSLRAGRSVFRILVSGLIFRTRPDRSCGPSSLLYNGYRYSFSGVKRPERGVDHPPHLVLRLKKQYSYISVSLLDLHGVFMGELHICLYTGVTWEAPPVIYNNMNIPIRQRRATFQMHHNNGHMATVRSQENTTITCTLHDALKVQNIPTRELRHYIPFRINEV